MGLWDDELQLQLFFSCNPPADGGKKRDGTGVCERNQDEMI